MAAEVAREAPSWSGAVLCGGRSRRMGRDKALLEVDGKPMVQRVANSLEAAGAVGILAIGGDRVGLMDLGLRSIPDRTPGEGPLGGIITALETCSTDIAFVVGCDLLAPSPAAMKATVAALSERVDVDVAVPGAQWLHAAWRRRTLEPLTERFACGERAVHRAVRDAGLVVATVRNLDPAALADADTPYDLD